ncbi:hypothetical protein HA402_010852 [Bradysia odoriphaga]|nr:hypothetical protein HA402_010852 [Bradysia odoriphaga]
MAQSRNAPPNQHDCNKNYDGPSSGMETQIIVEGFIHCASKGARFTKYVGDGDSSTYKALRDLHLYKDPELEIEKFECVVIYAWAFVRQQNIGETRMSIWSKNAVILSVIFLTLLFIISVSTTIAEAISATKKPTPQFKIPSQY